MPAPSRRAASNEYLGFDEPGTPFGPRTRATVLTTSTRTANDRFFDVGEQTPQHALTQGLGTIADARALELVAFGTAKAQALHATLERPVDTACPASLIQRHPCARVTADPAAALLDP